jgi:hypothetical protein
LKATVNASNDALAPNMLAVTISRIKPKMREIIVMLTTTEVDLNRLLLIAAHSSKILGVILPLMMGGG